jgi:hypothetical protein
MLVIDDKHSVWPFRVVSRCPATEAGRERRFPHGRFGIGTRYALLQLFIAGFDSVYVPAPSGQRGNKRCVYPNRPDV